MIAQKKIAIALVVIAGLLFGLSLSQHISVYQPYSETMTYQQLMSAGLLATPHFSSSSISSSSTTIPTTTIPPSPFTSHSIK